MRFHYNTQYNLLSKSRYLAIATYHLFEIFSTTNHSIFTQKPQQMTQL